MRKREDLLSTSEDLYLQLPSQLEFRLKCLAVNKIKLAINLKACHNKRKKALTNEDIKALTEKLLYTLTLDHNKFLWKAVILIS